MGIRAKGWLIVVVTSVAVLLLPSAAALAHEGEEEVPARTLVQQAIALLRGQPEQVDAIADKIHDALEAKDAEGVDLALVEQADTAFEDGDLHEAWDLLEESIGLAPHQVVASPNAGPRSAPTPEPPAEPSPVLHERAIEGGLQGPKGVAGPVLLGLAAALGALGLVIARRVR